MAETEFRRTALLGARILRLHGGTRRGCDPHLHSTAGAGRQTTGPVEPEHLRRPPQGGQNRRGRVSVPAAALSGSHLQRAAPATRGRFERPQLKSPRLCRGISYLLIYKKKRMKLWASPLLQPSLFPLVLKLHL